jgi:hypothetical protein
MSCRRAKRCSFRNGLWSTIEFQSELGAYCPHLKRFRADNPDPVVNRSVKYATAIVVVHLVISLLHGLAHHELHVPLSPLASFFVIAVALIFPLIAIGLLWTAKEQLGFILLSLTLFGSLIFGGYHHFMALGPDNVSRRPSAWGTTFHLTAYLLLVTEAIGACVGIHFLKMWETKRTRDLRWALLAGIVVFVLALWLCSIDDSEGCVSLLPGTLPATYLDFRASKLSTPAADVLSLIWYFAVSYALLKSYRLLVQAAVNRGDARWALLAGVVLTTLGGVMGFVGPPGWDFLLAPVTYAVLLGNMFFFPLGWFLSFPGASDEIRSYILAFGFSILLYSALSYAAIKAWRILFRVARSWSRGR